MLTLQQNRQKVLHTKPSRHVLYSYLPKS